MSLRWLALGLLGSACCAMPPSEQSVAQGSAVYRERCARCHGFNMLSPGTSAFDLRSFPLDQKERFVNSVRNGQRAMPAWGAVLQPVDLEALWAYVSSVPRD